MLYFSKKFIFATQTYIENVASPSSGSPPVNEMFPSLESQHGTLINTSVKRAVRCSQYLFSSQPCRRLHPGREFGLSRCTACAQV